ncbi:hypothetical protein TNCT_358011 [Trichonephila clavata]|uniref:Uncharacterized protein n=1 Tax=Trichonephila clavata TaxID=2740835 RepID=A0A8X6J3B8_TRICU|nr:hypothetical protein TNCT_358011 [Trichonephila clavata]
MKSSPDEGSSTCSTPRRSRNATVGTEGSLSVTLQGKTPTGAKSQRLSLRTTSQLLGPPNRSSQPCCIRSTRQTTRGPCLHA